MTAPEVTSSKAPPARTRSKSSPQPPSPKMSVELTATDDEKMEGILRRSVHKHKQTKIKWKRTKKCGNIFAKICLHTFL